MNEIRTTISRSSLCRSQLLHLIILFAILMITTSYSQGTRAKFSIPEGNWLYLNSSDINVSKKGFLGLSIGIEKFITANTSLFLDGIGLLTFILPMPVMYDPPIEDKKLNSAIISLQLCKHVKRVSYGLGIQKSLFYYFSSTVQPYPLPSPLYEDKVISFYGLSSSVSFSLTKHLLIAINYNPSLYNSINNEFKYSHALNFSFGYCTNKYFTETE